MMASSGRISIWDLETQSAIRTITTAGPGLFIRAHEDSPYVWADAMFAASPHEITVFEKAPPFRVVGRIDEGVQTLHPEFTADGRFVYVSDWQGDVVRVYDAFDLERVPEIEGIREPTGIFSTGRRNERMGH